MKLVLTITYNNYKDCILEGIFLAVFGDDFATE